jgi:Holliday junction resolvase RusA-like endonuclease
VSELVVRIPGEPFAQPRARGAPLMKDGKPVLKNGRPIIVFYDEPEAKTWKATAQSYMLARRFPSGPLDGCIQGPVLLRVVAVFTCPKSHHRKREPLGRRWHTKTPDADNVLKAVKDAAKGVLWLDDSQVALESCTKIIAAQGEAPYVLLRVRELHPDEIPRKETT